MQAAKTLPRNRDEVRCFISILLALERFIRPRQLGIDISRSLTCPFGRHIEAWKRASKLPSLLNIIPLQQVTCLHDLSPFQEQAIRMRLDSPEELLLTVAS